MKISCPACHATIPASSIDLVHGRAVCRPCNELVLLPSGAPPTGPLPRPADLRCYEAESGGAPVWLLTPSRWAGAGTAAFATFWCGFLFLWYSSALRHPPKDPIALWFPVLHVGVGVFLVWRALRALFNTTRVRLGRESFELTEGPIPSFATLTEATANIARFEAGQRSGGKRGPIPIVQLVTCDGRSLPLKLELRFDDHARWLAQRWNDALAAAQAPPIPQTYRG